MLFNTITGIDSRPAVAEKDVELFSGQFGEWLRRRLKSGHLQLIVNALIKKGVVSSTEETLVFLSHLTEKHIVSVDDVRVAKQDFIGRRESVHFRKLRKILGMGRGMPYAYHRVLGSQSHALVSLVLQGIFPGVKENSLLVRRDMQLSLFTSTNGDLFAPEEGLMTGRYKHSVVAGRLSTLFREELKACVDEVIGTLSSVSGDQNHLSQRLHILMQVKSELMSMLAPAYGARNIMRYYQAEPSYGTYLYLLMLLSWGIALLEAPESSSERIYFLEVPIRHPRTKVGAGTADIIEITKIGGITPTQKQRRVLRQASQGKFPSSGVLLRAMTKLFGAPVEVDVLDLKFVVGDGTQETQVLDGAKIRQAPLKHHRDQIAGYVAHIPVDAVDVGNDSIVDPWSTSYVPRRGELIYFLQDGIVRHSVEGSSEDWKSIYTATIEDRKTDARQRAVDRAYENALVRAVCQELEKPRR